MVVLLTNEYSFIISSLSIQYFQLYSDKYFYIIFNNSSLLHSTLHVAYLFPLLVFLKCGITDTGGIYCPAPSALLGHFKNKPCYFGDGGTFRSNRARTGFQITFCYSILVFLSCERLLHSTKYFMF